MENKDYKDLKDKKDIKILIVDDISKNIQLAASILQKEGYSIGFADNGKSALNIIENTDYDLILLDVMMPVMDGYEVCKRIKEKPEKAEIPIIFLSARNDTESIVKGFELGGVDYITKPFNTFELLARVNIHIELKKKKEELEVKNQMLTYVNDKLTDLTIKLQDLSLKDSLTGLYNHEYIHLTLNTEVQKSKRYGNPLSCLMIDIDHFKKVNDNYGHQFGDKVIKDIVSIIRHNSRISDLCGRYGGEEFLIVSQEDKEGAYNYAERLLKSIRKHKIKNNSGEEIQVTVSIGIATFDESINNGDDLIKLADDALYEAKRKGRDTIVQN